MLLEISCKCHCCCIIALQSCKACAAAAAVCAMSVFFENLNHQDATSCKQTIHGKQNCADNPLQLYNVPCSTFLFSENAIAVMRVVEESFFLNRVESQSLVSGVCPQHCWLDVVPMQCLWHIAFCRSGSDETPQIWEFTVFPQCVLRLQCLCTLARKESVLSQERLWLVSSLGYVSPHSFFRPWISSRWILVFDSVHFNHK